MFFMLDIKIILDVTFKFCVLKSSNGTRTLSVNHVGRKRLILQPDTLENNVPLTSNDF